jgi:glucose/arabinose dehydrogenase
MRTITLCLFVLAAAVQTAHAGDTTLVKPQRIVPDKDNAGLKLPAGFSALAVTDSLGKARHLVVNAQGNIYIKLDKLWHGKGIVELRDLNGDGRTDSVTIFGNYTGTGITIKDGYLYASSNEEIFRYKLNAAGDVINPDAPEKLVTGLVNGKQHNTKSLVLDDKGNMYVNIGSPLNSCQLLDRVTGSKGQDPCPVLGNAGGVWQFKADKLNQSYPDGVRYATGIRNVMGLDWNYQSNELFVMQHGRDQLDMFPDYYTKEQNAELPAEVMYEIKPGGNYGWPYCFFDYKQKHNVVSPEYGGDGKKTDRCDSFTAPVLAFPAHMAPNALMFYTGSMFPEKYKNGAFIAFHGSWNRAPEKQEGYYVVFAPFKNGKPTGEWEVFADGFSEVPEVMSPRQAVHRPCGLAQGPDGSLYVTDDVKGRVYRIIYQPK